MFFLQLILLFIFFTSSVWAEEPQRIVSLAPNVTETLYYLGAGDKIVGVTEFCNWPEEVKNKPRVGGMINPSYEKIISLKPDMVIISKDGTPKEVYERLKKFNLNVYVFNARHISNLPEEIIKLGETIGKKNEGIKIAKKIIMDINELKKSFKKQKAIFIIWLEPLIAVGANSHINEIMNILGLKNIASDIPLTYVPLNVEEIIKKDPEIIFIGEGHAGKEYLEKFLERIKYTSAVKKSRVYYINETIYHLSPRIIEGIKDMSRIGYNLNKKVD